MKEGAEIDEFITEARSAGVGVGKGGGGGGRKRQRGSGVEGKG